MKKVIKYILTFVITVLLLLLVLIGTAHIPREKIVKNIRETEECLNIKTPHADKYIIFPKIYTTVHAYADVMLLNIIYYIDTNNVLPSIMEAKYFSLDNDRKMTIDFDKIIDENIEANTQYIRYWHGSMSIVRPLLVFFNINQIYIINAVVLTILTIVLLIMLIKTKIKELIIAYIVGIVMCAVVVVPFCLEYFWTFLIMFIVSIIAIILNKKEKNLNPLFLITGICTCYFDFLTTEIITLFIPIIIILTIRYKQNKIINFKSGFKFVFVSMLFWGLGYVGMWFTKWILASIVLKINSFDYVLDDLKYRINGSVYQNKKSIFKLMIPSKPKKSAFNPMMSLKAIIININTLFPLDILHRLKINKILPICLVVIEIILIRKKAIKKLWFSGLLLLIAMMPYVRYAVLANHSYIHYFFTFRSQIISIMAIILAMIYSIDKDKLKKLRIRRKNGNNNINSLPE